MTFRPGPLRAAAALAAGFVVVRVVYRVLFHGADGSGPALLALPEWRLPAPFAHVVLLGPVTADGMADAALSALPIAATILAFGVVNALVDLPRLFVRAARRGPFSGIARALAIAWATLPSLAEAARSVRFAQRLRGERGGMRAGARMLAPLLRRTLERAGTVAAALELRGFAGRGLSGECVAPVEAVDVALGFGAQPHRGVVRVEALALAPGTLTLVSGPTGSGKSTLLRALAGLHTHTDGGWMSGALTVAGHDRVATAPRDLARVVGVVLQHPRAAFATERVRDEIGLALELRGVAPILVAERVGAVATRVGVAALLDRRTQDLSAGEATLVAIAAAIVEQPILLLVDEPLADLDAEARARTAELLSALAHEAGICVVVAEHRVEVLDPLADVRLQIADGTLVAGTDAAPPRVSALRRTARGCPVVLTADEITVRYRDRLAVDAVSLTLSAGEVVALVGPNGAGKSSLLATLALPPRGARVEGAKVAFVPDASDDLFVSDTVDAECTRADRRAHRGGTAERFAALLGLDAAGPAFRARLARHPLDLSVGERRCLAIAVQLSTDPEVMLVDEPTRGLDPVARDTVWTTLARLADDGVAVLVASHEPDALAVADRVLWMEDGALTAAPPEGDDPPPRFTIQAGPGFAAREPRNSAPAVPARAVQPELRTAIAPRITPSSRLAPLALLAANVVALGAFCWPLVAGALPEQAGAAVPVAALALAPLAALIAVATLDGTVRSAHQLALLGTLAAIGAAVRVASTGVGGVEAVFILLILAGRAFGARFALLLGMATIALSSVLWGAIGPWTPFQMFACAWVGAGAGLLPRLRSAVTEIAMLCVYGVLASYAFGLIMNLWFWPFAVGYGTGISYDASAPIGVNLSSFLLYSLITSTVSWDTLRAITTVVGLLVVGRPVLSALRRAKPLQPRMSRPEASVRAEQPAPTPTVR